MGVDSMKTPEDEAFDDLARRQGAWGGGFPAKKAMAADKLQEPIQEPFSYSQYFIPLDALVQNRIDNKGAAFYTKGDIQKLKHQIHELEGELIGYKKIVTEQDAMLEQKTARIVDLQAHIANLEGE